MLARHIDFENIIIIKLCPNIFYIDNSPVFIYSITIIIFIGFGNITALILQSGGPPHD